MDQDSQVEDEKKHETIVGEQGRGQNISEPKQTATVIVPVELQDNPYAAFLSKKQAQSKVSMGILPYPNVPTIKQRPALSVTNVVSVLAMTVALAIPIVLTWQKERVIQKEEEKKKEVSSFFVRTHIIRRDIQLNAKVVGTEHVVELNREYQLEREISQFMMGRVIGILDEKTHHVLL